MKKIKVTEKSGRVWEYINDGEVVDRLHAFGHGLPERWAPHKDEGGSYDQADVLEERLAEISPEVPMIPERPAVYEGGNLISEAVPAVPGIPAVFQKQVKLRAEYSVEVVDITDELERRLKNDQALAYLASTDWLIIREVDSGVPCPADVKEKRQAAREAIVK